MVLQLKDDVRLEEITNWEWAKKEIAKRVVDFDLPKEYITRCVAVYVEKELAAFLLTCTCDGIRSFHGFKFCTGRVAEQMEICRKYIKEEKLEFSGYTTRGTKAVLLRLGFKDFFELNGVHIMRKS